MSFALVFDVVMAVIAAFFVYKGLVKGFSGEIIGLVGLVVSTFCAWNFLDPAVDLASRYLPASMDRTITSMICAVAIFLIVEIIFAVVGTILSYVVKVTQLSLTDHFFGLVIGLVKAGFIILFVYAVIVTFGSFIPTEWMKDSYTMTGASYVWPVVRDFMQSHGIIDFAALTGGK